MMSAPALTAPARETLQLQIHVDAALLDRVTAYILTEKRAELPSWNATPPERLRFRDMVAEAIVTLHLTVPGRTQTEVLQETVGLLTGVGIVQQWIDAPDDARIEEVIVREGADGLAHVQLEVDGQIIDLGDVCPISHFTQMMRRAADNAGQTIKADSPLTMVTLPGGHRLTVIVPPLATTSLSLNVRKFSRRPFALADLVANGTLDQAPAEYLERVVADNAASILIARNSGTGKTTLLNALSLYVPAIVQLAIAETFEEMRPKHPYPLRTVAPSELTAREVEMGRKSLRDVVNTIYTRMRPDLIFVGEVVSGEAVEYLRAITMGCRAWTTIHSDLIVGGLQALQTLDTQYGGIVPSLAREMIGRCVNLVVHTDRDREGRRILTEMAIVDGLTEAGDYRIETLYRHPHAEGRRADRLARLWREAQPRGGQSE
jgi:pilus assembly protein CpaF